MSTTASTSTLYPMSNFKFGTKEAKPERDASVEARLKRLGERFQQRGTRLTCTVFTLACTHAYNEPHFNGVSACDR